jgi:hypothetical protein
MITAFAAGAAPTPDGAYRPGVCNIGPREIARRRMAGHVGLAATLAMLTALLVIDAPPLWRLVVIAPTVISASGYLQAHLRFCAGFAQRGIFNFGADGDAVAVTDADALAADRRRGRQISLASLGIGVVAGIIAVLLPL